MSANCTEQVIATSTHKRHTKKTSDMSRSENLEESATKRGWVGKVARKSRNCNFQTAAKKNQQAYRQELLTAEAPPALLRYLYTET